MNLYLRLLILIIRGIFFKPRVTDLMAVQSLQFRVLPNDLDSNMHMNNGRYLTIMDLGRFDLILRNGLLRAMIKRKAIPVLASVSTRYRISLAPFEPYRLETRVICWDPKWVYMEQRFVITKGKKAGAVAAIALVKGGFYDQVAKRTVPTEELLGIIGMKFKSPPMPGHVRGWVEAEDALRGVTAE